MENLYKSLSQGSGNLKDSKFDFMKTESSEVWNFQDIGQNIENLENTGKDGKNVIDISTWQYQELLDKCKKLDQIEERCGKEFVKRMTE